MSTAVAKKKSGETKPIHLNLRVPAALKGRIDAVAESLSLTPSDVVRLLLLKHLHEMEADVKQMREREA